MSLIKRDNLFNAQINSIAYAGVNIQHKHKFEAILESPNSMWYIRFPISIDINRNYTGNLGDEVVMTCQLPLGDFVYYIYPDRSKLEMTIVYTTVGLKYDVRYRAIITSVAKEVKNGSYDNTPPDDLNKEDYTPVTFQLLNNTVENFRASITQGVYKKMPVSFIINAEMFLATGRFSFFGGLISSGVEMALADNWKFYKQIVIPRGTKSKDVPTLMQAEYGVYNGGITTYIQNIEGSDVLFIYPPYRVDGEGFFKRKLSIYITNNIEVAALDNTYTVTDSELRILGTIFGTKGTGELKKSINDYTTALANAFKSGSTKAMATRPVKVSPKAVEVKKSAHTAGAGHSDTEVRDNQQPMDVGRTENFFALRSVILQNSVRVLHMQWAYSNARYLTPGMGVSVYYRTAKGMDKFVGKLHGVHQSICNNKQMEVCQLAVVFKRTSGIFDMPIIGGFF